MATIHRTADEDQKIQDERQEQHGKVVMAQLEATAANLKTEDATRLTNTKQTVKSHLGKAPWDADKPEEMEAKKVGKFVEPPSPITEIPQSAEVVDPATGDISEEQVDIIQVPTVRAEMGLAIPAASGSYLNEPEKTYLAVEEELGPPPEPPTGGSGEFPAHQPAKRSKKKKS
jgi:hypothetical protein